MARALTIYTGGIPQEVSDTAQMLMSEGASAGPEEENNQHESTGASIDELLIKANTLLSERTNEDSSNDDLKRHIVSFSAVLSRLNNLTENNRPLDAFCPPGAIRRKGFQLMGPEGIKEFDQDERLIMAMYSGATPLTETLQHYSRRVLKPRVDPAQQLLPLVRENLLTVEAQRAAERVPLDVSATAAAAKEVFEAAQTAFRGE